MELTTTASDVPDEMQRSESSEDVKFEQKGPASHTDSGPAKDRVEIRNDSGSMEANESTAEE
eukprot:2527462-Rhodomonas_salina.1